MITLDHVKRAREKIAGRLHPTPLAGSATLSRMAGREVLLKLENLQKTGSFKPRGALNKILSLGKEDLRRGVITISAGNHAQGAAFAASLTGTRAVVVMPAKASPAKVEAARAYGAEVILHGDAAEAFRKVEEVREESDLTFIHPFDDDATIAGQGTVGLEIAEERPDVETVIVPIGGGGLISGVSLAVKSALPSARVIGVEPAGAAGMHRSFEKGSPARLDRLETIADGLAAPFVGERNFEIARKYVDDLVMVEDAEICAAMRLLLERCKLLAEPAGAAALAALLTGKAGGKGRTAVVVSGGNVAPDVLASCIGRD